MGISRRNNLIQWLRNKSSKQDYCVCYYLLLLFQIWIMFWTWIGIYNRQTTKCGFEQPSRWIMDANSNLFWQTFLEAPQKFFETKRNRFEEHFWKVAIYISPSKLGNKNTFGAGRWSSVCPRSGLTFPIAQLLFQGHFKILKMCTVFP